MKNNFILLIINLILINFTNQALSQSFIFETKNIEILNDQNQINAYEGTAISKDDSLRIKADKFIYKSTLDILEAQGNGEVFLNKKKILIKFNNAIFNQKELAFSASGNIIISEEVNGYIIENNQIFYDKKNDIISSDKTSKISDVNGNKYYTDSFIYDINKNILKVKNLIGETTDLNTFKTSIAYINTNTKNIFGKDIRINLSDNSVEKKKDFRLYGNGGEINEQSSNVKKSVFTSCKKTDDCPPWQLSAKEIEHDKKKREISYKSALLKIYNIPIIYFPKFFHPDPTVRRRTGFLVPSITNSSNSGNYINIPYFFAPSDNKDFTFSPRFYDNDKILFQTEFRQKGSMSSHIADFSFFNQKNSNSKNHLFYNYDRDLFFKSFNSGKLNLKIQKISSDNYLRLEKIRGKLIDENQVLENSINYNLNSNDLTIDINSTVYENLNQNNNDKFEYIFPKLYISKKFDDLNFFNGSMLLNTNILARQYDTNKEEKYLINDLLFNSNSKITRFGFLNDHKLLLRNTNSENDNTDYKNKKNFFLSGIYQYSSTLPLIKENDNFEKVLKPKISFNIAPKHTKDNSKNENKIDLTNIYLIDRATDNKTIEGGASMTYGLDYSVKDKLRSRREINLKLANNLRIEENKDLSRTNQIGHKVSNIFSEIEFIENEFLKINYKSSLKNNLKDISYENLTSEIKFNNIVTTFDYVNENNYNKNSYLTNKTSYDLNKSNSLIFSTRKNKSKDITEYYKFMYRYKNDCLAASIEYDKDFYNDGEVKPEESLMFKLTIIPFGELGIPSK